VELALMIVVRVELHSAITGRVTELARAEITNDATGTIERGNYLVRTLRGRGAAQLDHRVAQRHGQVTNYPRRREHVWNLVSIALTGMGYGR
jgi:hypothetical protein